MKDDVLLVHKKTGAIFPWSEALAKRGRCTEVPAHEYIHKQIPASQWVNRYKGETVVVIASGPSLSDEQLDAVKSAQEQGLCKTIVVNNTYKRAPWATMMYARDLATWRYYRPEFAGEKWSGCRKSSRLFRLNYVHVRGRTGLPAEPSHISGGKNSGHQAICLAAKMGAARILLIGFDMTDSDGKIHWFGDHPEQLKTPTLSEMAVWRMYMAPLADHLEDAGIEVVNCSTKTALRCYKRGNIAEQLGEGLCLQNT